MRLVNVKSFTLDEFIGNAVPDYAILSHTWEHEEVSYRDMQDLATAKQKLGFTKIQYACRQAQEDQLDYVWVDTCCIDKSSSADLQEAINSMFTWYRNAEVCYAFLADVPGSCPKLRDSESYITSVEHEYHSVQRRLDGVWRPERNENASWYHTLVRSKWFSRGWTLQELIAPELVHFFGCDWNFLGSKLDLQHTISTATGVDTSILKQEARLSSISIAKRMSWAASRNTTRVEDQAYSLLGMFDINMPMLYGEGRKAFLRLQEEIIKHSTDHSIFAWDPVSAAENLIFAQSPAEFANMNNVVTWGRATSFEVTNLGLRTTLRLLCEADLAGYRTIDRTKYLGILNCCDVTIPNQRLAIRLRKGPERDEWHFATGRDPKLNFESRLPMTHVKDNFLPYAKLTALEIIRAFE